MSRIPKLKRYSIEIISLFGLLIVCLLVAFYVSSREYRVIPEKSIELPFTGVSVGLPEGYGWEARTQRWSYSKDDSVYYLGAYFSDGKAQRAAVQWRYIIEDKGLKLTPIFDAKAKEFESVIGKRGSIDIGSGKLVWVHMSVVAKAMDIFFGVYITADGRVIELEVRAVEDRRLAEKIFKTIAPTLIVEENSLLSDGVRVVNHARNLPLLDLDRRERDDYYIYKSDGETTGLGVKVLGRGVVDDIVQIGLNAFSHVNDDGRWLNRSVNFVSNNEITDFVLQYATQSDNASGEISKVLYLDAGKTLNITNLMDDTKKVYTVSGAAFPDVLDYILMAGFVEQDIDRCMVDMIMPEGYVLPVVLEKSPNNGSGIVVEINYLHGQDLSEKVYIDSIGRITRRVFSGSKQMMLLRSRKSEVIRYFPSFKDYINDMTAD